MDAEITAIPKIRRVKVKGNEIGSYFVVIDGKKVILKTQDYFVARERAREAVSGTREWIERTQLALPPITPTQSSAPSNTSTANWTSDVADAAGAGFKPDEVIPPAPEANYWSNNPEPAAPKPQAGSAPPANDSTPIPPELMDGLIKQIAMMLCQLQVSGQEWLILKMLKVDPGAINAEEVKALPIGIWESQVKKWIPTDVPLPEWAVAIVLTGLVTIPGQLTRAKPLKKEGEPDAGPS